MITATFIALVTACAPQVDAGTASALVAVESGFNPLAIGVVGGALDHQPRQRSEAVATARSLQSAGWNLSLGITHINVHNLDRRGPTVTSASEPCPTLSAMQALLTATSDTASTSPS